MLNKLLLVALVLILALLQSSCGLKRSNPLDPFGNPNVVTPDPVIGITYSTTSANQNPRTVTLRWTANSPTNTSGYYIYRGMGYFSAFALIDSVNTNEFNHSSSIDATVLPGQYYYRISAYKGYPGGNLEGRKSEPLYIRVP